MSSRDFSAWKAGLLVCGLLFLGMVNGEAASLEYGVYLTIQAESGEILYEKNCAWCHPVNFYEDIEVRWHGMRVLDYFYRMRGSMPADAPRSLADIEYLELVAWVLSVNGYPSVGQPLQSKIYLGL